MLPRIAVDDERWPISMSQIGAWRDFTQSMKLRWCEGNEPSAAAGVVVTSGRGSVGRVPTGGSGRSSKRSRSTNSVAAVRMNSMP